MSSGRQIAAVTVTLIGAWSLLMGSAVASTGGAPAGSAPRVGGVTPAIPAPAAPAPATPAHQQHSMSATGVSGTGHYTQNGTDYVLQAFAHDTAADGYCAEVWLDFTTNPHEHHGPLLTYACGNGAQGLGDTRHASSPDHKIKSFRMAICRSHHPGQRFALRNPDNGASRPVNCHVWPTSQPADWAVTAWRANDDKITQIH
jgi:hypothetical protein